MATTSISLIRPQTERIRPPRALWVPFPLGRPLGAPDDAELQHGVLRQAFDLLASATEPTIADYDGPEPELPVAEEWACPLNLGPRVDDSLPARLRSEIDRLQPWAAQTRRERGRTLFGASGAGADQVHVVADALSHVAEGGSLAEPPPGEVEWRFEMPLLIRHLADDLRTFHHEAIAAQPGAVEPDHQALTKWIFDETVLGEVLTAVADRLTEVAEDDPMARLVRGLLIPEGHYHGGTTF